MARKSDQIEMEEPAAVSAPEAWKRFKVTHYKVWTSQGRRIQGDFVELPASEGEKFVALGHMKHADPAMARR